MNANTYRIMKFLSLLSLLGCKSGTPQNVKSTQHGNFTIQQSVQTEKNSGEVQGRKYTTSSYLIEYNILYKGKKIKFPEAVQKGTEYNYPWRVYILKDASAPTLLAGSQNMFLITEKNNEVKIAKLNHHNTTFGSIQWLDGNHGKPGDEHQIRDPQNDDKIDSSLTLTGGKHLLVNRFTVLNVNTLESFPFNKSNIHQYEGWSFALDRAVGYETAVGFSAQFKQIVFRALKLDEKIEGKYYPALIVFNYETDSVYAVPFSRNELQLESLDHINPDWTNMHFEWNDSGRLSVRKNIVLPPRLGKLNSPDDHSINYKLYPAKKSMIDAFIGFLKNEFETSANKISVSDKSIPNAMQHIYKIKIADKTFQLSYYVKEKELVFDRSFMETHTDEYRDLIMQIANKFNEALSQKKHQEHFDQFE